MITHSKLTASGLLAATLLSGCATPRPNFAGPPITVKANSVAKERVVGSFPFVVRTFATGDNDTPREIAGATCTLKSDDVNVATTTTVVNGNSFSTSTFSVTNVTPSANPRT